MCLGRRLERGGAAGRSGPRAGPRLGSPPSLRRSGHRGLSTLPPALWPPGRAPARLAALPPVLRPVGESGEPRRARRPPPSTLAAGESGEPQPGSPPSSRHSGCRGLSALLPALWPPGGAESPSRALGPPPGALAAGALRPPPGALAAGALRRGEWRARPGSPPSPRRSRHRGERKAPAGLLALLLALWPPGLSAGESGEPGRARRPPPSTLAAGALRRGERRARLGSPPSPRRSGRWGEQRTPAGLSALLLALWRLAALPRVLWPVGKSGEPRRARHPPLSTQAAGDCGPAAGLGALPYYAGGGVCVAFLPRAAKKPELALDLSS
ncbi:basic proline-rich protein-like [Chrysemys picta bellii]|uniref:basic proline-rich protein-like n=1 Tax=Chrysemys picta bellii TaxID=8478 RepID=UPI0032B279B9